MYQHSTSQWTLPYEGDAIDTLLARHYKACLRTANRILRSKEDSEDAVQTACCAAFQRFHRFRGDSSFKTWITRIVVNCCLVKLRERRAVRQISLGDIEGTVAAGDASPESLCYVAELQAAHANAVTKLPKPLQCVYVESIFAELALQTVADQVGLSPSAVKSRLFRARRRVEHSLQPVVGRSAA